MKLTNFKIITAVLVIFNSCTPNPKDQKGTVDISKDVIMANVINHKAYDVEVCNSFLPNMGDSTLKNAYTIYYYQSDGDTLKSHSAHIGTKEKYDKCDYQWDNDSTITFRLFNEQTKKSETHTAWGKGGSAGLKTN